MSADAAVAPRNDGIGCARSELESYLEADAAFLYAVERLDLARGFGRDDPLIDADDAAIAR